MKHKTTITAEQDKQDIFISRTFDAPRDLVFRAFLDPVLYVKWQAPPGHTMVLDKFEPVDGGSWRYLYKNQNGNELAFHGIYHEVLEPARIISTFEFEGLPEPGHVSLETTRFEELPGGKTGLTIQIVFQSIEARNGMLQSGMEGCLNHSHTLLDELLENL